MTTHSNDSLAGTSKGIPGMPRAGINGKRPELARVSVKDDGSGSGLVWARSIEFISSHLVVELERRFLSVTYDYVGMHDMAIGEADEYLLQGGSGEDLLRAQKLLRRSGGGDADETFFQTVENHLSAPDSMPYTGASEALGMVMFTTSNSKPAKHNTVAQLGAELKRRRIKLFVCGEPGTNMEDLVRAADGFFFPLRIEPTPAEAQDIATRLAATVKTTLGGMATSRRDTRAGTVGPDRQFRATLRGTGDTVARP
jgi:hypothetical protein